MKKLFALLLIVLMIFAVAGCGEKKEEKKPVKATAKKSSVELKKVDPQAEKKDTAEVQKDATTSTTNTAKTSTSKSTPAPSPKPAPAPAPTPAPAPSSVGGKIQSISGNSITVLNNATPVTFSYSNSTNFRKCAMDGKGSASDLKIGMIISVNISNGVATMIDIDNVPPMTDSRGTTTMDGILKSYSGTTLVVTYANRDYVYNFEYMKDIVVNGVPSKETLSNGYAPGNLSDLKPGMNIRVLSLGSEAYSIMYNYLS